MENDEPSSSSVSASSISSSSMIISFLCLSFKGPSLTNRFGPLIFDFLGCLIKPPAPAFGSLATIIV